MLSKRASHRQATFCCIVNQLVCIFFHTVTRVSFSRYRRQLVRRCHWLSSLAALFARPLPRHILPHGNLSILTHTPWRSTRTEELLQKHCSSKQCRVHFRRCANVRLLGHHRCKSSFSSIKGNTLHILYHPPMRNQISQQAQQQVQPFEIEAVLQGTRPVGYSTGPASTGTSAVLSKPGSNGTRTGNIPKNEGLKQEGPQMLLDTPIVQASSSASSSSSSSANSPAAASADVGQVLAERVVNQAGAALSCLPDAACFPMWRNATAATVLLVLLSPVGGRYCTGTLLAGPDPGQQLILTANHCR